jgi:hypothetical protein
MKKIIFLLVFCLALGNPGRLFSQSGGQKNDQKPIDERVTVLEKGQAGLKVKNIELKNNLVSQQQMADSVCKNVKAMEQELMAKTDSIKARLAALDLIQQEITTMQKKLSNRKTFSLSSSALVTLCFILLIIIIIIEYRRIRGLKNSLEEMSVKMDEGLGQLKNQQLSQQNTINTLNLDLHEQKTNHQKDHTLLEDKVVNLGNNMKSETDSLKASSSAFGEEIKELLEKKLQESDTGFNKKIGDLSSLIDGLKKLLEQKEK